MEAAAELPAASGAHREIVGEPAAIKPMDEEAEAAVFFEMGEPCRKIAAEPPAVKPIDEEEAADAGAQFPSRYFEETAFCAAAQLTDVRDCCSRCPATPQTNTDRQNTETAHNSSTDRNVNVAQFLL